MNNRIINNVKSLEHWEVLYKRAGRMDGGGS